MYGFVRLEARVEGQEENMHLKLSSLEFRVLWIIDEQALTNKL